MVVVRERMVASTERVRHHAPEVFGSDIVSYSTTFTDRAAGEPQWILVEVPQPGHVLKPHYHASDQFQLVLDGAGRLGSHEINPVSLHYTNRYTGYGPIVAGPQGLAYYVLRPAFDPLGYGQYLHDPELRERAKRYPGRKRAFMSDGLPVLEAEALASYAGVASERLFAVGDSEPDAGLFADMLTMGPGLSFTTPDPHTGGGQVVFVLAGSARYEGRTLERPSAIAVSRDEAPLTIVAGEGGLQALVLQYPRWSTEARAAG